MKNLKKYLGILFLGALSLTSCQDMFDAPEMADPKSTWLEEADKYELMSIADVKANYWSDDVNYYQGIGKTKEGKNIIVRGRVISSDAAGNVYKSLVIQDKTGALAISINANSLYTNYRRGQEVVINLSGTTIGKYAGLQQLGFPEDSPTYGKQTTFMPYAYFTEHCQLNGRPDLAEIDTITVNSLSELSGGPEVLRKWQSQLVRFNNCSFENGGKATFAVSKTTTSQNLLLSDGSTLVVRTSGYANFYSTMLPEGKGDVVGILGYFNNAYQLTLIDVAGCMNFGNPTIAPGGEQNPYTVDQAVSIVNNGGTVNNAWTSGYIVGAVAPGVTEIKDSTDIQFSADVELPNTLVIAQSADVKDFSQVIVVPLPQGSKLREYGNLVDHKENYGKQLKLVGTIAKEMGITGITGNKGTATEFYIEGVTVPGGNDPSAEVGDGSEAKPYNVDQVVKLNPQSTTEAVATGVYVTGYIVGSMPTGGSSTTLSGTIFGLDQAATTNFVIATSADVTDYNQCIGVQLGTAIRDALSLAKVPGNLGKKVTLKGDVMKYCGGPGLKNVTNYVLGEGGETPSTPAGDAVTSLNEKFTGAAIPTTWSQAQVAGNKAWYGKTFGESSYAAMSGYNGVGPFDQWLISPAIDMSKVSDKKLSFDTQVNGYGSTTTKLEVYVMTAADPAKSTNTKLNATLAEAPASGYSSWTNSGSIDLSAYKGVIYIGWRYTAQVEANTATWCVTNVALNAAGGTTGGDTPGTPVTGNAPDFNTMNGGAATQYYGTYSSATGWTAANALVLQGGAADANPVFTVFGDASTFAVCLNGKSTAIGTLTSPTLAGGIGTLSFDYCQPFSDTKCSFTVNIKQNGAVVASDVVTNDGMTKLTKYSYSHAFNVKGSYVIEIVNNAPSASTSNKDRVAIWNMSWTN